MRLPSLQLESPRQRRQKTAWWLVVMALVVPQAKILDVASISFPSTKNQDLIEPVGLWNQQRGIRKRSLALDRRRMRTCTHSNNYFASNSRKIVNLAGLLKTKQLKHMVKWIKYGNRPASKWYTHITGKRITARQLTRLWHKLNLAMTKSSGNIHVGIMSKQ